MEGLQETMSALTIKTLVSGFSRSTRAEAGQGLSEYALILALIALIAMGALQLLSGNGTEALSSAGNGL
jgi:Flp pilus assembly pilin Flp